MRRIANHIDGEVLLVLNLGNLKSELGIESLGERFDIVKAIVDELYSERECEWLVEPNIANFCIPSLPASRVFISPLSPT
jgi:hypothetical protein